MKGTIAGTILSRMLAEDLERERQHSANIRGGIWGVMVMAAFALFVGAVVFVRRNQFYRTNGGGVEEFDSFSSAIGTKVFEFLLVIGSIGVIIVLVMHAS